MGFYFPTSTIFGIPEREDTLMLKNTLEKPYELFATDQPNHLPGNQQPLYGSIPYITSVAENHSAGLTWINAAHTYISVSDMDAGKYVNFVSESGSVELFFFASSSAGNSNRVKKV